MRHQLFSVVFITISVTVLSGNLLSCADSQPPYECAAQNMSLYQIRYYKLSSGTCDPDAGFVTNTLSGGSASMETYKQITPNGDGGGLQVEFRDTTDKLDLSATKLGIRLDTLTSATATDACDNDLNNNCATPDEDFECRYCVNIVGDGGPGTTYTLLDGTNGEDTPLADGGRQGVERPIVGGVKRISLANACEPGKTDDITRSAIPSSKPDFFLMLPRFGSKGVCAPLPDSGVVTSTTTFPKYTCSDMSTLNQSNIDSSLSNFKLISSASIIGNIAKANIKFVETVGTASCTTEYKLVLMTPQVTCFTDYDCSPDPIPTAPKCGKNPLITDYCLSWQGGATTVKGSGITPNLVGRLADGGYDLRGTCDPQQNICIWDADAGI